MSHANQPHDNFALDHDTTSKRPSKSSQPPITMESKASKENKSLWDSDRRVYLAKKYRTQIASGPAAMISVVAGAPFENLKTRMQSKHFPNAWDCTKYTFRTEGIRGFWAGTLPPLVSLTFSRVGGFSVYQKAKYYIDAAMEKSIGVSPLRTVNTTGTYPDAYTVGCFTVSGCISGATMAFIVAPFELIKNATQTSVLMAQDSVPGEGAKSVNRVSTLEACKQIIARRGFKGFYTGFQLHLLRDTVGSGIYFGVYEAVKQAATSYWHLEKANTPGPVVMAGALCGILSWVATYPLDTMKTRAQNTLVGNTSNGIPGNTTLTQLASAPKPTALETAAKVATATARASKWKGVEMIILRSSIQNMIQMLIFETFKNQIIDTKFSDGSTDLPKTKREKGRDRKVI